MLKLKEEKAFSFYLFLYMSPVCRSFEGIAWQHKSSVLMRNHTDAEKQTDNLKPENEIYIALPW